jgi:hypothetical protein
VLLDFGLNSSPNWYGESYIQPDLSRVLAMLPKSIHHKWLDPVILGQILGTIYNISYVIVINLVLQAILSGVIIDAFQNMRSLEEANLREMHAICQICSIPREKFELKGLSFEHHIQEEHSFWNYFHFWVYVKRLSLKDPKLLSQTEIYFLKTINAPGGHMSTGLSRLIPIYQSMSINNRPSQ